MASAALVIASVKAATIGGILPMLSTLDVLLLHQQNDQAVVKN